VTGDTMEDVPGQRLGDDGHSADSADSAVEGEPVEGEPVVYVLLTILPDTGEIEAYGPMDGTEAIAAVGRFEERRKDRADGLEPGVLVVPLRRPAGIYQNGAR
jgi:hypothetical protein